MCKMSCQYHLYDIGIFLSRLLTKSNQMQRKKLHVQFILLCVFFLFVRFLLLLLLLCSSCWFSLMLRSERTHLFLVFVLKEQMWVKRQGEENVSKKKNVMVDKGRGRGSSRCDTMQCSVKKVSEVLLLLSLLAVLFLFIHVYASVSSSYSHWRTDESVLCRWTERRRKLGYKIAKAKAKEYKMMMAKNEGRLPRLVEWLAGWLTCFRFDASHWWQCTIWFFSLHSVCSVIHVSMCITVCFLTVFLSFSFSLIPFSPQPGRCYPFGTPF